MTRAATRPVDFTIFEWTPGMAPPGSKRSSRSWSFADPKDAYNDHMKKSSPKKIDPIRVGILGLGQIALKAHLPGYFQTPGCRIMAVHSRREAHAKQVATQYGIPMIFKDWTHLVDSD